MRILTVFSLFALFALCYGNTICQYKDWVGRVGAYNTTAMVNVVLIQSCALGSYCVPDEIDLQEGFGKCRECTKGQYCVPDNAKYPDRVGFFNALDYAFLEDIMCPGGYICNTPTDKQLCPLGSFCPEGTNVAIGCAPDGIYCPNGSEIARPCRAGYFCKDASHEEICPKGYKCKQSTRTPYKCQVLSSCPAGTSAPPISFLGIVGALVLIVGMIVMYLMSAGYTNAKRKKRAKNILEAEAATQTSKVAANFMSSFGLNIPTKSFRGFTKKENPISLRFENLGLRLRNGKIALKGASGEMKHSKLTAIMGPSGAGKTTMLNALCGKAHYGDVFGKLYINGEPGNIEDHQKVMGFVPQDDVLHSDLTVYENLHYSASLRLPRGSSKAKRTAVIADALEVLGLQHVRDSPVGSVEKRGISGGQRKRVNIGVELVADPTVLFLDEPTSGLDATSSSVVLSSLKEMTRIGMTIVTVIHQPRYSIFTMFDDVLLLGNGGKTIFIGPTRMAMPYFNQLGHPCPENENPADFFLDVISDQEHKGDLPGAWLKYGGEIAKAAAEAEKKRELFLIEQFKKVDTDNSGYLDPQEVLTYVRNLGYEASIAESARLVQSLDLNGDGKVDLPEMLGALNRKQVSSLDGKSAREALKSLDRTTPFFPRQARLFFNRALSQLIRGWELLFVDLLLIVVGALVIGLVYGSDWTTKQIPLMGLMSTLTLGLISTVAALRIFGAERLVAQREAAAGVNTFAYFMAKNVVFLLDVLFRPLFFLTLYYNMTVPGTKFLDFYWVMLGICWAMQGVGMIISVILTPANALLAAVLFPMITGAFFGGVQPSLKTMKASGPQNAMGMISFTRWGVEALTVKEYNRIKQKREYMAKVIDDAQQDMGMKDHYEMNLMALFFIGLIARILCFAMMTLLPKLPQIKEKVKGIIKPSPGKQRMVAKAKAPAEIKTTKNPLTNPHTQV